jgi:hypothetical protein
MSIDITDEESLLFLKSIGQSSSDFEMHYPRIIEPLAKPSDLDLTAREFFYWCDKGVIDIPKSEEGQSPWSRLNLIDVIWVRIIKELRAFNFPFQLIVKIKETLFQNFVLKLIDLDDTVLESLTEQIKDKDLKLVFDKIIKQVKADPDTFNKQISPISTIMGALVAEIFLFNSKIHLHICKVEEEFIIIFEGYSLQQLTQENIDFVKQTTHLSIYLNELIAEHLLDSKCEKINSDFGLITEQELQILDAIRNKEVSEITINKGHNEKLTLTITKRSELKDNQVQMIKRLLRMNEYDDVRAVLRNDKHIYLENKIRKKL